MSDLFVEVFPIISDSLPLLTAYRLILEDEPPAQVVNRLANRLTRQLRRAYSGVWLWSEERLLTDTGRSPVELAITADLLKSEQPEAFGLLQGIEADVTWKPTPQTLMDMVLKSRLPAMQDPMQQALSKLNTRIRNASVQREYRLRPWLVNQQPSVSISIASRMLYDQNLQQYAGTERDLQAVREKLVGLHVIDSYDGSRGEVINIIGAIAEHRERLLRLAKHEETRQVLQNALDGEWIVKVMFGREQFEVLASALQVVVRLAQLDRFEVDAKKAAQTLQMTPAVRATHVKTVSDIAKEAAILDNAFNSRTAPDLFLSADFEMNLRFDENRVRTYKAATLAYDFTQCGVYKLRAAFKKTPIRVCVVNTLTFKIEDFVEAMRRQLQRHFNFTIEVIRERQVRVVSRSNIESAVRVVEKENPDIILAFFADDIGGDDDEETDLDATVNTIKSLTLGRGIPTQVIYQSTLDDPDAMPAIIMNILGKTGSAPFVLAEPLEYADTIVGLDIVRDDKPEAVNLTAIARIYRADGEFVQYRIRSMTLEGDTLPYVLLRDLLPQRDFAGKRIVIHHDGRLPDDLMAALNGWGQAIKATFYPVEIVRFGAPCIYGIKNGVVQPPWGSAFKLNDNEALLVSSLPQEDITSQPLHIRTVGAAPLAIEKALRGILVWTLLAYNAERLPKLPVTVMNADELDYWLRKGGKLSADEGEVPFWL